jgi:prophage regulatory protein
MTDFRLVDKKGLKTIYGIPYSHQHIARLEKAGAFPRRIQLGPCRVAWQCSAVEAWIASRLTADDDSDAS